MPSRDSGPGYLAEVKDKVLSFEPFGSVDVLPKQKKVTAEHLMCFWQQGALERGWVSFFFFLGYLGLVFFCLGFLGLVFFCWLVWIVSCF